MVSVFERPLISGWIYPCTVEAIRQQLSALPPEDLVGLWAVGLVPSTRKDCTANGRYFGGLKPTIHLYSYPETLTYKQPAHVRRHDLERSQAVEIHFGMRLERVGSRWVCRWEQDDLRRFTLEHVLLHEVGHHVHFMRRRRQGLTSLPSRRVREQFAETYAGRHLRNQRG